MKECPICGKRFVPNSGNQKYCSPKCCRMAETERNIVKIAKRNAIQDKAKRENRNLIVAYGFKCAICGWRLPSNEPLKHGCQLHHIKHVSDGGTNNVSNLILLCPNCHKMAHSGFIPESELRKHTFTKEEVDKISEALKFEMLCNAADSLDDAF